MKILFVGYSHRGSNARGLREALDRLLPGSVDDIGIDLIVPNNRMPTLKAINRFLRYLQAIELERKILQQIEDARPDFVVVYKCADLTPAAIRAIKAAGPKAVLVFPDYSPHAFGTRFKAAVGEYDLVCSTKPYHPELWKSVYGYDNRCVTVPHGFNPIMDVAHAPPTTYEFDVIMISNGRPEYYELMQRLARGIGGRGLKVAVAGPNWTKRQVQLPEDWVRPGAKMGLAYHEWLRKAKIVIAPLNTRVVIGGVTQPGDVDTSRTYHIPAAYCFCVHRRSEFLKTVYDEETEMPMYDDVDELAKKIIFYLDQDELRRSIAAAAHARAVPAYSLDNRARQLVAYLRDL